MGATTGEKRGAFYDAEALRGVPIEDVLRRLNIENRGKRYYCPGCQPDGHGGGHKTPDLDTRRGRYKCFKCGAHGDPIDLVELALACDFKGAAEWLSREFGVPMREGTGRGPARRRRPRPAAPAPRPEPKRETPAAVSVVYEDLLRRSTLTPEVLAYCAGRGWSRELLARYDVAAIDDPARIFRELTEAHGTPALEAAGLLTKGGYFRFAAGSWRHPIMFPFYSRRTFRVEYVQARRLCPCDRKGAECGDPEGHGPKYMGAALAEGRALPCLWNDLELANVPAGGRVHVTEGVPDALTLCGAGLVAVAVVGAGGLSASMIRDLLRFDVVLCGDRDDAGKKFNRDGVRLFAERGVRAHAVLVPRGKDWADYLKEAAR